VCLDADVILHEDNLGVSENSVVKTIFESKKYVITGEWRKLHEEELFNLYQGCPSS
jgi:hypothetical protein